MDFLLNILRIIGISEGLIDIITGDGDNKNKEDEDD